MPEKATLVPAVQYVRASTERQQYSIEYQCKVISRYAAENGFEIFKTFSDEARSGLDLKGRPALCQLLAEVTSRQATYQAILVFDVSRFGRFQDTDEAAHYEYVCKSAGIPIHYCAEPFSSVGGISDSLLKTLKRFMAGEFSRDLSDRASGGINNIVERGFKYGSVPGYGLRRMLVAPDGRRKQLLAPGELKNISSDRVIFVPGPADEIAVVRDIYRQFVNEKKRMTQIVRRLNEKQVPWTAGRRWTAGVVKRILSHPKYVGTLIFNQTDKKLHRRQRRTPKSKWIVIPQAFEGLVDPKIFAAAQKRFASITCRKSDEQLLDDLRRLLAQNGTLNSTLLRQTRVRKSLGLACATTYFSRLGSFSNACQLLAYDPSTLAKVQAQTVAHRRKLVQDLFSCFPDEILAMKGKTTCVLLQGGIKVLIRICRSFRIKSGRRWTIGPGCDGNTTTLAAIMNEQNTGIEALFILPSVPNRRLWTTIDGTLLKSGIRLDRLTDFCRVVRTVSETRLPYLWS